MPSNHYQEKPHPFWAGLLVLLGGYPLAIATGLLEVPPDSLRAPAWVLGLAGMVFVIAGCMVGVGQHSRWNHFLAGVLCLVFAVIGGWVALLAPSEGFSGGFPLLPHTVNAVIGRWVFGLGALLSLLISIYAFVLFRRRQTAREDK